MSLTVLLEIIDTIIIMDIVRPYQINVMFHRSSRVPFSTSYDHGCDANIAEETVSSLYE